MEGNKRSVGVAIALGVLLSVAVLLAGAAVLTTMILNETIGLDSGGFASFIIVFLAAFLGSVIATNVAGGKKRALITGCSALALFLVLTGANILFFNSVFPGIIGSLTAIVVGSALPLLLIGHKGNRSKRHHKIHYR
jgi:hypothetical protein